MFMCVHRLSVDSSLGPQILQGAPTVWGLYGQFCSTDAWRLPVPLQWPNQSWQTLEEGCRKARLGDEAWHSKWTCSHLVGERTAYATSHNVLKTCNFARAVAHSPVITCGLCTVVDMFSSEKGKATNIPRHSKEMQFCQGSCTLTCNHPEGCVRRWTCYYQKRDWQCTSPDILKT